MLLTFSLVGIFSKVCKNFAFHLHKIDAWEQQKVAIVLVKTSSFFLIEVLYVNYFAIIHKKIIK